MISTKQWVDLLSQQYALTSNRECGLDLLLSVKRFTDFLHSTPHAQVYLKELDEKWSISYQTWLSRCEGIRIRILQLEQKIRIFGTELGRLQCIPETNPPTDHVLEKLSEDDWYQHYNHLDDNVSLNDLPSNLQKHEMPFTRTARMADTVRSKADGLATLAKACEFNPAVAEDYHIQAKKLYLEWQSAVYKLNNDWQLSGKYALEQLDIVVSILNRDIFINYFGDGENWLKSINQWKSLLVDYAPQNISGEIKRLCQSEGVQRVDCELLIRTYLRQLFDELLFLANSRLTYIHLVEQFKVRCESYDWKRLTKMINDHAEEVAKIGEVAKTQHYRQFEELLTLEFARYLYDNGYPVYYRPREGVHEPDLVGRSLEPIVVEAKVLGIRGSVSKERDWILNGLAGILGYLKTLNSQYNVTEGYLVIFRIGDSKKLGKKIPMFDFSPEEWRIGQFTIIPIIINLVEMNKDEKIIHIDQEAFITHFMSLQNGEDTV